MSEAQEDKIQRFFPGDDARCGSCHCPVFWVSRAAGPDLPDGLYEHPSMPGDYTIAYSSRAIAAPGEGRLVSFL